MAIRRQFSDLEWNSKRWAQLKAEVDRVRTEGGPENEELLNDLEGMLGKLSQKDLDMSYVKNEQLEELGKILFALIDHLGLKVVCDETKSQCNQSRCMRPDCVHEKKWHIKPKSKEYKKDITKLDDLIMTGEGEDDTPTWEELGEDEE